MMNKLTLAFFFLFFASLVEAQRTPQSTHMRIMLSNTDKIEHAGFYWAQKKGLFMANGVKVTLLTPHTQNPLNKLEYGEVDIAIETLPMALQKNQKTRNLVLVHQLENKPALALVSQNQSFKNMVDFEGQTLFYPTASYFLALRIWLSTEGLSVEGAKAKIKFRSYARILTDFTTGKISHAAVPLSWLPLLYNKVPGNLQVFMPKFVKGATLGKGLYVTRKKYNLPAFKAKLNLFLSSLDQAYKYVFRHQKEAIDTLLTTKEKLFSDEVLMKQLDLIQQNYTSRDVFKQHYEHSLQNIMNAETVSEIKEYPKAEFLGETLTALNRSFPASQDIQKIQPNQTPQS